MSAVTPLQQQQQQLRALYDYAGDASSNTPAFSKGDIMTLVTEHPNGWLEVEIDNGTRGYVAPAWVEAVPSDTQPHTTTAAQHPPSHEPLDGTTEEEQSQEPLREEANASIPETQEEHEQKQEQEEHSHDEGQSTAEGSQQQHEDPHAPKEGQDTDGEDVAQESRPLVIRKARARKPAPPKRLSSIMTPSMASPQDAHGESYAQASASTPAANEKREGAPEDAHTQTTAKRRSNGSVHVSWDNSSTTKAREAAERHDDAPAGMEAEGGQAPSHKGGGRASVGAEAHEPSSKQGSRQSSSRTHTRSRSEGQPRIFFPPSSGVATTGGDLAGSGDGGGGDGDEDDGMYDNIHDGEQQEQADQHPPASASAASNLHVNVSDESEHGGGGERMREAPKSAPLRPRPRPRPNRPGHSRQASHPGDETAPGVSPKPKRASVYGAFQQQLEATLVLGGKPPRPTARSVVIEGDAASAASQPPQTPAGEKPKPFRKAPAPPPAAKARRPSSHVDTTDETKVGSEHPHPHPQPQRRPHHSRNASGNLAHVVDRPDDKQHQQQKQQHNHQKQQRQPSGRQSPAPSPPVQRQQQQQQQQQQQPPQVHTEAKPDKAASAEEVIALHGPLERKAIREGGRDVRRRQWHKVYAVVEGPLLVLFSSKKDFEKQKRPTAVIDLGQNSARIDEEYTKRDFVFTLEGDLHKMLFQAPSEADVHRWLNAMHRAQSFPAEARRRAQTYAAPARERASPKTKRHSVMPDGDIQVSAPSPKDKEKEKEKEKDSGYGYVRRRLNKYLRARPKKQELVSQGIIEYPVFGGTITHQVEVEQSSALVPAVPIIVVKCVHRVERSVREQGIYRVPGNAAQIQHLVAEANDDCVRVDVENVEDVHAAAGLLKLYFRELADPPFTDAKYSDFIAAGKMKDATERRQVLCSLFKSLPDANQATLKFLFQHLTRVAEHGAVNKMHLNNLAIVFGPTLLRSSEPTLDAIVMDAPFQSNVVEELIKIQDTLSS